MSLALLTGVGPALVSWGLGGPGGTQAPPAIHCPTVLLHAAAHVSVEVQAAAHVTVEAQAAAQTIARVSGEC